MLIVAFGGWPRPGRLCACHSAALRHGTQEGWRQAVLASSCPAAAPKALAVRSWLTKSRIPYKVYQASLIANQLARIIEFLGSRRALPQTRVASAGRRFTQYHIVQAGQTVWLYSDVTCAFPSASGRVIIVSIGFVRGIATVRKSSHDLVASPLHRLMPVNDASSRKRSST